MNEMWIEMYAYWKRILMISALASPVAVIASYAAADQHSAAKEQSNHQTNKKAIAMEAKEDKLSGSVRDWSAIDTDKDHLISPEEMQKYLHGVWSSKGKS